MEGKVYLVGGGPGALELYTLKAMECIREADCLIYDRLIDPQILQYVKANCECIYVGKESSHHTLPQLQINQLLVDKAHQYQNVVRLKGGDVYVFGRGGEEALTLYENGIDFEVVPGLSSSIAGLCYGGIPITHRGMSSGFEVVTAHHQDNQEHQWDYQRFLNDDMTYVFMMGKAKLEMIVHQLLKVGKDPHTPIAIIANATMKQQESLYGQLDNILLKMKQHPLPSPLLIVVGRVVDLHHQLNFYERKPFFHKRILVVTVTHQQLPLTKYFDRQGAMVKQLQIGKIHFLEPQEIPEFQKSIVVFTSQNGMKGFFSWLKNNHFDYRKLSNTRFACIGKKTAQLLSEYGFMSDFIASEANSECFNHELESFINHDERLIVVQEKTTSSIQKHTNNDLFLDIYENIEVEVEENEQYDLVCLTCASSVKRLAQLNCQFEYALSIGPMTSMAIHQYFPKVKVLEASQSSYQGMIQKVEECKDVL